MCACAALIKRKQRGKKRSTALTKAQEAKKHMDDDGSSDTSDDYSDDEQEGEADYRVGGYHRVRVRAIASVLLSGHLG